MADTMYRHHLHEQKRRPPYKKIIITLIILALIGWGIKAAIDYVATQMG